ncbi:MAG: HAD-IA family hydrolase [Candidatus Marinimicrobia bacterium]|nr:HAD-IA family hydrolase [Candidatus Neomarinimicrobiota bacterium]
MIKAVIFDLDNTLLDFMTMKSSAVNAGVRGMKEAGLNVDTDETIKHIFDIYNEKGYEYQEVFDDFIKQKIGHLDYRILASAIMAYRKSKEANLMLYPNVNRTLFMLSKMGLKLGVVSDAPSREAWLRLCYVNLHHIFDAVVTFDVTGVHKPLPVPFLKVTELLDIPPEEMIMIGDWPERDVIGAKEVGMMTAFAKYGDTFGTEYSGADFDLNDIYELISIVNKINNS